MDILITYSGTDPTTTKPAEKIDWMTWVGENSGTILVVLLVVGILAYSLNKILGIKRRMDFI